MSSLWGGNYMQYNRQYRGIHWTQYTEPGEVVLSDLFIWIQLTSFSETELLWQINNLKSHMHKMWIAWGWKMTVEMMKREDFVSVCVHACV